MLELLQNESTLTEIASKHNILPQNLVNCKKTFLANAEFAMEPSKAVKEYKEELIKSQEQNERLTTLVGKVTLEKEWLAKNLKSLGLSKLKQLVDLKSTPTISKSSSISINHQCQLLGINRSGLYYKPRVNHAKQTIKSHITKVFEQIPIYGEKKVHKQLLENGIKVSLNTAARYRQGLGLKAVLSYKISNTMDSQLVMIVLNDALAKYPYSEIFNTDQGSEYTSEIHTQRLKNLGITISMDGRGRATDNICIERFWRSAKVERIYLNECQTINDLATDLADYIEFYNHRRFHETLGYKKPMDVYQKSIKLNQIKKKAS